MERFNLKKLNDVAVRNSTRLSYQIGLQLPWLMKMMMMWTSKGLEKGLERI